jgi:hypothetical protein
MRLGSMKVDKVSGRGRQAIVVLNQALLFRNSEVRKQYSGQVPTK